jgi:hypothetical protein
MEDAKKFGLGNAFLLPIINDWRAWLVAIAVASAPARLRARRQRRAVS